ncbi:SagB/ThcOx family dehydrogenase [Methylomonas sp. SURF-2]|uniref:SagB/ThcOx family dehydrogenase n=1 Tax=Methylomonas subterranea TaxID=2952225 RepID=A0ABT1TJW2_9GAMM|nr:SagB/ThcOx family dehydrogenase [Methylomonas sp. SURF-2]MCQ8105362.1 SagB/ThcOx family dehydrogenase [Methylomonas sp. SURF-2]
MSNAADTVLNYHQRTKHQLNAYAKGPESLDWDDQPNPFRRFKGCETLTLPPPGAELDCLFADLDRPEQIAPQPLTLTNLGLLLELSFGLSAWKQFGPDRWALRCNPSSGNLHPTEAYLVCTDAELLRPGVYHYVSHDHHLERRAAFDGADGEPAVYIGLSSVHWREAWKYGERAFRYCQHDIGHALAALSYAAACLGWSIELLGEAGDNDIARWLGLDRREDFVDHEHEAADLFCRLHTDGANHAGLNAEGLAQHYASATWFGQAERLSGRHFYRWPIIDEVAAAALKPATQAERRQWPVLNLPAPSQNLAASRLIRQRRSAQHFNGKADPMAMADFQRILLALLPNAKPPFTAWNWPPQIHLLLFVHRVDGLEPGLYFLPRDGRDIMVFKQAFSKDFVWQAIEGPFEFYRLVAGNVRQAAKTLSCHQPIASDSAFSLGMLARFAGNIEAEAWRYRRLFWESGLLGQILYLEAEAAGIRGTGIGCFFDDAVHGVLGLRDNDWQSLYHFTLGTPLDDGRLQTQPAYAHLRE